MAIVVSTSAGLSLPALWTLTAQMLGAGGEVSDHSDKQLELLGLASV